LRRALRVGVVGLGRIAQVAHLPAIEKSTTVELAAVLDTSAVLVNAVKHRYGGVGYTDIDSFLEADMDGVLVCVPDRMHFPIARVIIESGRHVLVEKPLAVSVAEATELVELGRKNNVNVCVGYMKRHDPAVMFARANREAIGEIYTATAWYRVMAATRLEIQETLFPEQFHDTEITSQEKQIKRENPRYRLTTHGSHLLDQIRFLTGEPSWVSAQTVTQGVEQAWHGTVGTAQGGLASFDLVNSVHGHWAEGFDLYGSRGHISIRSPYVFSKRGSTVKLFDEAKRETLIPTFTNTDLFKNQIDAFSELIRSGESDQCSGIDAINSVRFLDAVFESLEADGRKVAL
jgi:predicted dehydrogenase